MGTSDDQLLATFLRCRKSASFFLPLIPNGNQSVTEHLSRSYSKIALSSSQQYSHVQERALTNNTSLHPTDRPKTAERLLERPLSQLHHKTVLVLPYHLLCDHCCLHFHFAPLLLTPPTCGWHPVGVHGTEKGG